MAIENDLVAHASIDIDALADDVWFALTDPAAIERYMFGAKVVSDWRPGSPIRWSGEFDGKRFEDHGEVIDVAPGKLLRYTHVSGVDGSQAGHVVNVALAGVDGITRVTLTQDGNRDEAAMQQSEAHWNTMLDGLKKLVEQKRPSPL